MPGNSEGVKEISVPSLPRILKPTRADITRSKITSTAPFVLTSRGLPPDKAPDGTAIWLPATATTVFTG